MFRAPPSPGDTRASLARDIAVAFAMASFVMRDDPPWAWRWIDSALEQMRHLRSLTT